MESPSDSPSDPLDTVHLELRLAAHPVHPAPQSHRVECRATSSILDLKRRVHSEWDGNPNPDGITLIKGGRVCRDSESLDHVFLDELATTTRTRTQPLVLHVVVRASASSQPFTQPPPPVLPTINTTPPSPLPSPSPGPDDSPPPPTSTSSPPPPPPPAPPLPVPTPTSTAPLTSSNPYLVYLGHLQRLIPIQRSLLLLNLQKAHHYYQHQVHLRTLALDTTREDPPDVVDELAEVESLLKECGLWRLVREREDKVEQAHAAQTGLDNDERSDDEFKVVQLDGLPYLLHTPRVLQQERPKPSVIALRSLSRASSILKILTTMLQLLITFQPNSPAVAHGRSLLSRSNAATGHGTNPIGGVGGQPDLHALAAAAGVRLPGPQPPAPPPPVPVPHHHHHHRAARRAATISITLHLDSLVQFLVPLFFLSVKLAFLLFIFARHASPTKRSVLIGMAVAWVLYEGVRIARRRRPPGLAVPAGAGLGPGGGGEGRGDRDRDRDRDRERRRLARDLAHQAQANQGQAQGPEVLRVPNDQPAARDEGEPGPAPAPVPPPPPRRRHVRDVAPATPTPPSPRRAPASVFSPKYWINSLAAVGLVSEARELGLSPRYIAGRPISQPPRATTTTTTTRRRDRYRLELRRLARVVTIAVVLFFATLVPEVERKRKKALEKRDRLLAEKKVRWEREREKAERERELVGTRNDEARSTTTTTTAAAVVSGIARREGDGSVETQGGLRRRLEGRERVSDAELFIDGTSEAFTSTSEARPSGSSVDPTPSTSSEPSLPIDSTSARLDRGTLGATQPSNPDLLTVADEDDLNLSPDDEGDGDIAASASVSDTSDDEEGRGRARGGVDDGDRVEQDEGQGGIVAIF